MKIELEEHGYKPMFDIKKKPLKHPKCNTQIYTKSFKTNNGDIFCIIDVCITCDIRQITNITLNNKSL